MLSCIAMGNAQDLINQEILQQLQTIGKGLDQLETKKCKKNVRSDENQKQR